MDDFATTLSSKTQSTDGVADLASEDMAAYLDLRPTMSPVLISERRQKLQTRDSESNCLESHRIRYSSVSRGPA